MSKLIDLTGQTFGNWKVLERAETKRYKSGGTATAWLCQCIKNPSCQMVKLGAELRLVKEPTCKACPGCHEMDLTGKQFGRWTVLERADDYIDKTGRVYHVWKCQCGCEKHTIKNVLAKNLLRGTSQSCGCIAAEFCKENFSTHRGTDTRLYGIWTNMRKRCINPNDSAYPNYGGRGITVCEEWNSFENFRDWAEDNGYDDTLTIDRINNNVGYSPDNCRWADYKTQANNTRNNVHITLNGETHTISQWGDITGVPAYEIAFRIRHGWNEEDAVMTPLHCKPQQAV